MEKFRNLTKNIFFKIFLSFVALSFVAFGVGDFLLGGSKAWIAKIDKQEISYNEFAKHLRDSKNRIYKINPSQEALQYLNSKNFRFQVLNDLIIKRYINIVKDDFGLYPDQELILQSIAQEPSVQAENGGFDRNVFINYLRENNLTEKDFIDDLSDNIVNNIVKGSLQYHQINNSKIMEDIYKYQNQKRNANVITISRNNIKQSKKPQDKELADFFQENQKNFSLPELRNVSYIEFSINDILPNINVTNQQILEYYNNNSDYDIESSKNFYHIVFGDEDEANSFLLELNKNSQNNKKQTFLRLSSKMQQRQEGDLLMNNIKRSDLLPQIQDKVFALKVNNNSDVIKSDLGFHVFYLLKENAKSKQALTSKLKSEIKKSLLYKRKEEALIAKIEEIDDMLLTSNSLESVLNNPKIKLKNLNNFAETGYDIRNKDVVTPLNLAGFANNSFNFPQNEVSELFYSKANSKYYALLVQKISPARDRQLSEVKNDVIKLFLQQKASNDMTSLADKIYSDLVDNKSSLTQIAKKYSLGIRYGKIFSKDAIGNGKEINFIKEIFNSDVGSVTRPYFDQNSDIIKIAKIRNIINPKFSKKDLNQFKVASAQKFSNNILSNYYNIYLQNRHPLQIKYELLGN